MKLAQFICSLSVSAVVTAGFAMAQEQILERKLVRLGDYEVVETKKQVTLTQKDVLRRKSFRAKLYDNSSLRLSKPSGRHAFVNSNKKVVKEVAFTRKDGSAFVLSDAKAKRLYTRFCRANLGRKAQVRNLAPFKTTEKAPEFITTGRCSA